MVEIFQNIRKIYVFSKPCEELAEFIEFFSESSLTESKLYFSTGHSDVKMFPSWTPTFYINLGTPYYIDLKNTRYKVGANEDILILRNHDVTRHKLPTDNIFTVKFYPGGLEAVLGINQIPFVDQVINLNQILPMQLLVNMKQPISFEERIVLMQSFLLNVYLKSSKKDHYLKMVNDAIGEYSVTGMQLNTTEVAKRLFLTSKTINRYFKRVVGISPKGYFSILRARTALTAFMNERDKFVPLNYGYYDLSHFHKDVIKFTGQKLGDKI
jgi:AraC-like DNA-binding protein